MDLTAVFPVAFASEEAYLLTAIVLGFLFGFALERGGFANARKLAAQFYLYDMTVFKVMFTAILVAGVGFYTLAGAGLVDLSRMWINPTFLWAQLAGGFLLGVGFIISGLCPGTAAVSMASGRYDGAVTLLGIVAGTALFAVLIDWFPGLLRLYEAGGEVSVLPALLHLPAPVVLLGVVIMAAGAFIGAEKVERLFRARYGVIELTPEPTRRTPAVKFAVAGSLAGVVVVSVAWKPHRPDPQPVPMAAVEPVALAEALVARDPDLMVLDLRTLREGAGIPGAFAVTDSSAVELLAGAAPGSRVVVYDETGARDTAPAEWPRRLTYQVLRGGLAAWRAEVLEAPPESSFDVVAREQAERRRQLAAYFSGAGLTTAAPPAPPPAAAGGAPAGKKRSGGC
jgi:rhodanese-related sulfurtransferase